MVSTWLGIQIIASVRVRLWLGPCLVMLGVGVEFNSLWSMIKVRFKVIS